MTVLSLGLVRGVGAQIVGTALGMALVVLVRVLIGLNPWEPEPIVVVGGMVGASVLIQHRTKVDKATWQQLQPKPYVATDKTRTLKGPPAPINANSGRVDGAWEAEDLKVLHTTAGSASAQRMSKFAKDKWSGDKQLFWSGGRPGDRLELNLNGARAGTFTLETALTRARDYATVQVRLDDQPLGKPIDLYNYPDVITTGVLNLGELQLAAGDHCLTLEITGANQAAMPGYRVGIDFVRLAPK